jgi:hypothetical protein
VTPNQVLGDVMTDAQYDDDEDEDEKEIKVKQEKTTAFKASSSKGKSKVVDDDDPFDDETMALLVQKMGRFMKKRDYGARKRRDHIKSREMLCYNCKSLDYVVADCPYEDKRFHDGELKMKKNKKDKKEKKEKKSFTINKKKKKGGGYVVTWNSNDSNDDDDDESSSDDEKPIQRAIASISLSNKSSLFDTTSTCLMVKPTKVQYDDSDDDSCDSDGYRSDDDEDEDYFKDDLMDIIDQMSKGYKKMSKKSKMLEQELIVKSNENNALIEGRP